MAWPTGQKKTREDVAKRNKTRSQNLLKKAKQQYIKDQIITEKLGSIIHWDTLSLKKFKSRTRRAVQITCGRCRMRRWVQFDNLIKLLRKPWFTGCCLSCMRGLTWIAKGRYRPEKRKTTQSGYIKVYIPENPMADKRGEIYEHRLIMSNALGRSLKKWEHVHHKDGNRTNNNIDNLELVSTQENQVLKDAIFRVKYLESLLNKHNIPFT